MIANGYPVQKLTSALHCTALKILAKNAIQICNLGKLLALQRLVHWQNLQVCLSQNPKKKKKIGVTVLYLVC